MQFIPNYYKHYGGESQESNTEEVVKFIEKIENALIMHAQASDGKKPFLGGIEGKPAAVDFIVWPWLERLEAMSSIFES